MQAQVQEINHLSIDPILPAFGTIQLQYERGINENMSVGLSVGYKLSSGIFTLTGLKGNRITTDDFNFNGLKIIPEFKWYVQQCGLSGFYVGGYAKYLNYDVDIDGTYIDDTLQSHQIDMVGNIETVAIGAEVGYKLMIKKRFFMDFIIAGPGVSFNTFELKENTPFPQAFYNDLSDLISNYGNFENFNTDIKINPNQKSETMVFPAFRYGLKLGYAF